MNISDADFLQAALQLIPELQEEFLELDGLLHLQMDRFRYRVEVELDGRNSELVLQSFRLIETCLRYGSDNLQNAADTCFVEGVLIGHDEDTIRWGWDLMPHLLKEYHIAFWGHGPE